MFEHGPAPSTLLADRLRELRESHKLIQRELGAALRPDRPASVALISGWENRGTPSLPGEAWLSAYARLFAPDWDTRRVAPRLLEDGELTPQERTRFEELERELLAMRREAVPAQSGREVPVTGALGGRFWHFPDGEPIMIIGSHMPPADLRGIPFADQRHPDYMHMLQHADSSAVVELFGHLRAENPNSDVRFRTSAEELTEDDLSGHVVVIGGGDFNEYADWFAERRADYDEFPHAVSDPEPLGRRRFVVGAEAEQPEAEYEPTFTRNRFTVERIEWSQPDRDKPPVPTLVREELRSLQYDIALVARQPNPLNTAVTTATLVQGLYNRGTYGSVRTFTDARLREANEDYRQKRFGDLESYWMLIRVLCNGRLTLTPDLNREYTRLQEAPE